MENENLPIYALRYSAYGERSFIDAVLYTGDVSGKAEPDAEEYARTFRRGLLAALGTLATLPMRFPVAPEAAYMDAPPVRVMPHRSGPSRPAWRVLYRVHEANENDAAFIEIVAVRHGAQKPITSREGREIDAENRANR